jgi:UDP-N-acetylglucosamine transferase subunit ALG13
MEVEQMMAYLLEEMSTIQDRMDAYQEMMDDRQEKMKAQVVSLASRINVSQEKLMAKMHTQPEKMEACLGKTEATGSGQIQKK